MTTVTPTPRAQLTRALNDLARAHPLLVDAQYSSTRSGELNTKVATSGHGDVSSQWRPAATQLVQDLTYWAEYLGRMLVGADSPEWPRETVFALATAARPRLARALLEHPHGIDILPETLTLRDRAQRALHTQPLRRRELPYSCVAEVLYDEPDGTLREETCGATLSVVFDGPKSRILCSAFPIEHRIDPSEWDRFFEDMGAARG